MKSREMRDTARCRRVSPSVSGPGRCFDCRAKNRYSFKQRRAFVNVIGVTWGVRQGGGLKRPSNIFSAKEYSTGLREGQIKNLNIFNLLFWWYKDGKNEKPSFTGRRIEAS